MDQNLVAVLVLCVAAYLVITVVLAAMAWSSYRWSKAALYRGAINRPGLTKAARRVLFAPLWPVTMFGGLVRAIGELFHDAKVPR